jgi:hypothetical protein
VGEIVVAYSIRGPGGDGGGGERGGGRTYLAVKLKEEVAPVYEI